MPALRRLWTCGETRNSDRIRAIKYVTDRVLGKVPQAVEVTTPAPLTFPAGAGVVTP